MNSPIKILSALALGGLLVGTAVAGPGDAYAAYGTLNKTSNPVSIALYRSNDSTSASMANCPNMTERTKLIPSGNSKSPAPQKVVLGTKCEGMTISR